MSQPWWTVPVAGVSSYAFAPAEDPLCPLAATDQDVDMAHTDMGTDADTPVQPATLARSQESVEGMTEVPTTAPTIGNVRKSPAPYLAAGVQYRTPMVMLDGLKIGTYHVAGASQSGSSRLINGSPRQDAYDFVLTPTGRLIVAVADGLGSRPSSQVGARLFCEQVVMAAVAKPDGSAWECLIAAADRAGGVAEAAYALTYDDISFVAAVAIFDSNRCELARVGDVSGFILGTDNFFEEMLAPHGGPINVVAASLPSTVAPISESIGMSFTGPIVLATDGLANDIRTSAALRVWLGEQWQMPLGAFAMAESLRYRRQGSHDDRTAVVVWPQR